jgi:hypothetical protein
MKSLKLLLETQQSEEELNRQFIRDFTMKYSDFTPYFNLTYDTLAEEFIDNILRKNAKKITSRQQFDQETDVIFEKYYMPARPNQEEIESPFYVLFALQKDFSVLPSDAIFALYTLLYLNKINDDRFLFFINKIMMLNTKSVPYFLFDENGKKKNYVYEMKEEVFLSWLIVPEFLEVEGFIEFLMLVLHKKYKKFFFQPSIVYRRKLPEKIFSVGYIGYERYGIKMSSSDVNFNICTLIEKEVSKKPKISLLDLLNETSLSDKKKQEIIDMTLISFDCNEMKIPRWFPVRETMAKKADVNDLINAVNCEHYGRVKSYLQHNRKLVDVYNNEGLTPLMIALKNHKFPAIVMMISSEPNVLLKNPEGKTILEMALYQPRFFAIFVRQASKKGYHLDFNLLKNKLDIYHNCFELFKDYYLQELVKLFFSDDVPLLFEIRRYLYNPHVNSSNEDRGVNKIKSKHSKKSLTASAREKLWIDRRDYLLQFWLNPKIRISSIVSFLRSLKIADKLDFTICVKNLPHDYAVNDNFNIHYKEKNWKYHENIIADFIELFTYCIIGKCNMLFWLKIQLWNLIFAN